jgi:hypothetical protein
MREESDTIINVVLWGALAGFGGAVKYVASVIRSPTAISYRRFLLLLAANTFISSFCGLMGLLLAFTLTNNWAIHGLLSGGVGYLGIQGLDMVLFVVKRKIDPSAQMPATVVVPSTDSRSHRC